MISERARRALLGDLVAAGDRMLGALKRGEQGERDEALRAVDVARATLADGYVCDMSAAFDKVEAAARQAALRGADDDVRALRAAVNEARGYVLDPYARGHRWAAIYYGPGVRRVWGGEPTRHKIEVDARMLCDRFGVKLVASLLRVTAATSRIAGLLHLTRINSESPPHDTLSEERNFHLLALLTFAYLKELTRALSDLSSAGIERKLSNTDPWRQLQDLRRHWETGPRAKVRDEVMFHVGHQKDVEAALSTQVAAAPWLASFPLQETDADSNDGFMRYTAGEALVLTSSGLTLSDLDEVARDAVEVFGPLLDSVFRILDDLLRQCGAQLPATQRIPVRLLR